MSTLRKELSSGSKWPCMSNGTAYLMILAAVQRQDGLLHGRLHGNGAHCAIGSYFAINDKTALSPTLVDEVVAVNDSVPHLTNRQRKHYVAKWLRWKLSTVGFPGTKGVTRPPEGAR